MSLLLKVKPLVISPELACRIGLNEAIVLQQICYWLEETTAGVDYEGRRWVYNTIEDWNKQFPWWSSKTVKRAISSLKGMGLLYVEQLKKNQHDQTNYYSINHVSPLLTDRDNLSPSRGTSCPNRKGQSVPLEQDNLTPSIRSTCPSLTENTTEITTKITSESVRQASPAQHTSIDYPAMLDAYHEILTEMPRVADFTDFRRDKVRSFWRKFNFNQDRWVAYLRYIKKNCRWMCENRPDKSSGRTWRKKNFDYLITERCYLSVKEERANDLPASGHARDITAMPSADYDIPDGFRG
ncbi:transcriptional regulator [Pantoea sp. ICBG 1758]|uniref:transcriptional regulator n=1 Tax=Pantoea sp. ICBG 1758 TaxID=2071682 RepID=UPI000CE32FA0|nr:transcriptional regulator [Pantoea sp. ICBG 1758]PPC64163.1 transcriptional regulator [Pantoea sp. ICBG 1758]